MGNTNQWNYNILNLYLIEDLNQLHMYLLGILHLVLGKLKIQFFVHRVINL